MTYALDLGSSWDGFIVIGTLVVQFILRCEADRSKDEFAKQVELLSLVTAGAVLVSAFRRAACEPCHRKAATRRILDSASSSLDATASEHKTSGTGQTAVRARQRFRRARDQGLLVGLFLPFLCILGALRANLLTPAQAVHSLSLAFCQAWCAAWTWHLVPEETPAPAASGDRAFCRKRRPVGTALLSKVPPLELNSDKEGAGLCWAFLLELLWLHLVPLVILRRLSGTSWMPICTATVATLIVRKTLASDAFAGTFTYGEALLVSFLVTVAWFSPFHMFPTALGSWHVVGVHQSHPAVWQEHSCFSVEKRLVPAMHSELAADVKRSGVEAIPLFHLFKARRISAASCTEACGCDAQPPRQHGSPGTLQQSRHISHACPYRRLMQRYLLKTSVELATAGILFVNHWHRWLAGWNQGHRARASSCGAVGTALRSQQVSAVRNLLRRFARPLGLALPLALILPLNYLMARRTLKRLSSMNSGSFSDCTDADAAEPFRLLCSWMTRDVSIMVLVLYWAVTLAVGIFALGPHRWKWRRIVARKYYHLLALLLFMPVILRQDPLLWQFLSFAQTVALAVLIALELARISGTNAAFPLERHSPSKAAYLVAGTSMHQVFDGGHDDGVSAAASGDRTTPSMDASLGASGGTQGRPSCDVTRGRSFYESVHQFMTALVDERDQGSVIVSHLYLLLGCAAPGWLLLGLLERFSASNGSWTTLLTDWSSGLLSLGVFDTAACILGSRFGRHHWPHSRKTIEGSLGGFIATWLCQLLLQQWHAPNVFHVNWTALARFSGAVFLCTVFEALTAQNDNLVLPMFCFAVLGLFG